jgi:hypothetical protein
VNSRKYVNHNSADVWSYDPATATSRYERHSLSQNSGDPIVHDGLLYWPFEDSRFSPGRRCDDVRWQAVPCGKDGALAAFRLN